MHSFFRDTGVSGYSSWDIRKLLFEVEVTAMVLGVAGRSVSGIDGPLSVWSYRKSN